MKPFRLYAFLGMLLFLPGANYAIVPKTLVVVGGGYAGSLIAKAFEKPEYLRVILVDPKNFYEVPMSITRSMVTPKFADQGLVPFSDLFPKVEHVQGSIEGFDRQQIRVRPVGDENQPLLDIPFDYLVLATGTGYPHGSLRAKAGDIASRKQEFAIQAQKIEQAQRLLIVGGGDSGVEMAAEVAAKYPEKHIMLIHQGSQLLRGSHPQLQKKVQEVLEKVGVSVRLNSKIDIFDDQKALLSTGEQVEYDHILWTAGAVPHTNYFKKSVFKGALDKEDRVQVDSALRLQNTPNIFVAGDILSFNEFHSADRAKAQSGIIINNIKQLATEKNIPKWSFYRPSEGFTPKALSLGSRDGLLALPNGLVVPLPYKSSLATFLNRKSLGLSAWVKTLETEGESILPESLQELAEKTHGIR